MSKREYIDDCLRVLSRTDGSELREIAESLWDAGRRAALLDAAATFEADADQAESQASASYGLMTARNHHGNARACRAAAARLRALAGVEEG